ncbi:hypothetical protein [Xanthomonas citri phage CP2]|uniref:exonuclease n=1 Tax=Xanthomonas citri phage CP2 TaxID=1188795 RepID=UPI00029B71E6|nr:exonuclease [Xanthomonas citri phage CP2]BAM66457.1 hypothetical protein [Xanthomonas citri phage CP2]
MLDELQIFEDLEQGTPEWHAARCGVVTASVFHTVLAKGRNGAPSETRKKLLYQLAAETITGEYVPTWDGNKHTERGHVMEPQVRDLYMATSDHECRQVGFMRRGRIGCSPDTLVGDDGLLEIKTKLPHLQIEAVLAGKLPSEHVAQVQGQLLVSGRQWCDFRSYWPGLPELRVRVHRDLAYLSTLNQELQQFIRELDALVAQIKAMA